MEELRLKEHLGDSDSAFDEHSSVASNRLAQYAHTYKEKTGEHDT